MLPSATRVHTIRNALELNSQMYVIIVGVTVSQDIYRLTTTVIQVRRVFI